jgi:hypothetical protein
MYIDAGTGSMLLQAAAAVFFTGLIFVKDFLRLFGISRRSAKDKGKE